MREQASETLRRSNDRLLAILEGVADGITVQDSDGRLIFANDEAARMIGYPTADELLRAPLPDVLGRFELADEHGHPFPPSELPGRQVLQGMPSGERVLHLRDRVTGEERWSIIKARSVLGPDGKPEMAINMLRDITGRKRAEEAQKFLADATALLASSLDYETTLARVAHLAVPGVADWCAVHLVGESGELRSLVIAHADPEREQRVREIELRHYSDPNADTSVARVTRTGEPELYPEITDAMLAEGARDDEHLQAMRYLGLRSAMIVPMQARGRTLGAITFASAESGRRYGPEELELGKHLGRRAALAVENARLYGEAQEAVRVRNELFSSVSHDLKNPLTGIKGMAQLLKRHVARQEVPSRERLLEGLSSIDDTATRMTAQIDELLDLARLQTGQPLALSQRPVDLVALARETAVEQQRTTEQHRIVIETELNELVGNWDPVRLGRVATNLLSNAIKYSPRGGVVRVVVAEEERDERRWALLVVQDRGVGIPSEDLPRVFEGFHRAGNVADHFSGTGLGLASARQVVELHGGRIEVASEEGSGSTFTVRLPLDPQGDRYGADSADSPNMPAGDEEDS